MSQRKEKQKRREARRQEERRMMAEGMYTHTLFDLPPLQEKTQNNSFAPSHPPVQTPHAWSFHPLQVAIEPAVWLYIMEFYERGGPRAWEFEEARAFGNVVAAQGDKILYRGKRGETARLYDGLAKAIAVLAHVPGGVSAFGHTFDVIETLSSFAGRETAEAYWQASTERYYEELVVAVNATCCLPQEDQPLGPFNVIRWFEKASEKELLQIRKEGYNNLDPGNKTVCKDRLAAQILETQIFKRAERIVKYGGVFTRTDKGSQLDTSMLPQAQKLIQARDGGKEVICQVEPQHAEAWLNVFRHTLVTGEQWLP